MTLRSWLPVLLLLHVSTKQASAVFRPAKRLSCQLPFISHCCSMKGQDSRIKVGSNADLDVIWSLSSIVESLRAGASVEETIEEGDNEGEADVEAYDREEVDEEEEEEGEEDDDEDEEESLQVDPTDKAVVSDYDVMLVPSPSMQMYSIIGVMLLSRKLDMFNPTVVRAGRYVASIAVELFAPKIIP